MKTVSTASCLAQSSLAKRTNCGLRPQRLVVKGLAPGRDEALKQMEQYRLGLRKALNDKEQKIKDGGFALNASSQSVDASTPAPAGETTDERAIREITKDDYDSCLQEAGDKLVVVDFFTTWCGPCKAIMPLLLDMQDEFAGQVVFAKFNCNKYNKELGQSLGIKVAPTFHLYRNSNKVAELTGAKVDELRKLIETHK